MRRYDGVDALRVRQEAPGAQEGRVKDGVEGEEDEGRRVVGRVEERLLVTCTVVKRALVEELRADDVVHEEAQAEDGGGTVEASLDVGRDGGR